MDFKRLSFDDRTDFLVWMLSTLKAVDKSTPAFNIVKIRRRGLSQKRLTRSKTKWGSLISALSFYFNRASKEKLESLGNKVSQDLRYAVHSTVWFSWQSFQSIQIVLSVWLSRKKLKLFSSDFPQFNPRVPWGWEAIPEWWDLKGKQWVKPLECFYFPSFFFVVYFFVLILLKEGGKAALILRRAPRRHSQACPLCTNIIHYQQWGHMEMMLTQSSLLFSNELGLSGPGCLHLYLMIHWSYLSYF